MDNYSRQGAAEKLREIGYTEGEVINLMIEATAGELVPLLHRYQLRWTGRVYTITRKAL